MIDYITDKNGYATGLFTSRDLTHANLLRRAILSEIETYAIEYVIFQTNTSSRHDEVIALKLGQLVIDHSKFNDSQLRYKIDVGSDDEMTKFTSDDIIGLPITYRTPIATLLAGQHIKCEVIITKGQAKTHVKWRPVGLVAITEIRDGYFISALDVLKNSVQQEKKEQKAKYYIDSVIIEQNNTTVKDEFLAVNIGLLDIKSEKITDELTLHIRKTGPGSLLTINDKHFVEFNYFADIGYIGENQIIECFITVKWGLEKPNIKWKTFKYDYADNIDGYQFRFKNIGMLTTEEIFSKGFEKISAAANREPITIFSQVRGKERYG